MRLLLDEMWSPVPAEQLRRAGHDVIAVLERSDLAGTRDRIVLRAAAEEGRTLVTEDLGFRRLAASWIDRGISHAGIIITPVWTFHRHNPRSVGRLVRALDALLRANPDLTNAEHWLQPPD